MDDKDLPSNSIPVRAAVEAISQAPIILVAMAIGAVAALPFWRKDFWQRRHA